jgi:hypothetical protein
MTIRTNLLAAAAAMGALAVPAAAQSTYPYQSYQVEQAPQPYPGQPGYGYGQPYGGQQPGYAQGGIGGIIDQLLGNRYNVTDRQAVSRCVSAAMVQASAQYRGNNQYGNGGYGNNGYANNGYAHNGYANALRVTSITDVRRHNNGLRVSGLMSSGYAGQYGNQNGYQQGYQNRGYGDVSFRCNVDYRGQVTNVRIGRNNSYRG